MYINVDVATKNNNKRQIKNSPPSDYFLLLFCTVICSIYFVMDNISMPIIPFIAIIIYYINFGLILARERIKALTVS